MLIEKIRRIITHKFSIIFITVCLLSATFVFARVTNSILHEHAEEQFDYETEQIIAELNKALKTYLEVLNGHQSFFIASSPASITYENWNTFVNQSNLLNNYPGIHVISFARYLKDEAKLVEFEENLKEMYSTSYSVWPKTVDTATEFLVNEYVAPIQFREVGIGYNHFTEVDRKEAALKAKETGEVAATTHINLITNNGENGPGYILYAPIFNVPYGLELSKKELEHYWYGNVIIALYVEEFVRESIPFKNNVSIDFTIFDGEWPTFEKLAENREHLLFSSSNYMEYSRTKSKFYNESIVPFTFADRSWTVHFQTSPTFRAGIEQQLPLFIIITGLIISILVFLGLRSMASLQKKSAELAKKMTEELRKVNELQEAVLNSTDNMIISTSYNGKIQMFNRAAERHLGYRAEEVIQKHEPLLFNDPNELQNMANNFNLTIAESIEKLKQDISENNRMIEEEVHYVRKDGTVFPVFVTITALRDNHHHVIGTLIIAKDLSQIKAVQKKIIEKDQLLSKIIHTIPHPIFMKNEHGEYLLVNEAKAQLYHVSKEEMVGTKDKDFHIQPELERIRKSDRSVLLQKKTIFIQEETITSMVTGEVRWFNTVKLLLQTSEGPQILGISIDITERKWFEEELIRLRDKALAASQAKSDFLAMMSHEIRTPLNVILGMADLLAETELVPEQKEYVEICKNSSENLLRIINDVLDLAKVEAGQVTIVEESFLFKKMIAEVISSFEHQANKKGLTLSYQLDKKIPEYVQGDKDRLRQVLSNLINNAIKFTDEGFVKVKIKGEQFKENNGDFLLHVEVEDTGVGIPAEKLDQVFERFIQVDTSSTRRFGGTGLGLTIVRSFVEKMGGTVRVSSEVGKGSTFSFTIKLTNGERRKELPTNKEEINEKDENMDISGKVILLVEDAIENQLLIQTYLKKENVTLEIATNGLEAMQLFEQKSYDIILMDIQMPVMDGYTATAKMREYETAQGKTMTPIVALTAHALKENEIKAIQAGCNGYLTKPIKKADLVKEISRYIHTS